MKHVLNLKNKLHYYLIIVNIGFLLSNNLVFSQIISDATYQIYSENHDSALQSPTNVNQDDSGDSSINNLFGTTSDVSNTYQQFEFTHQGGNIYKIRNIGTNQFIGIKDGWCDSGGEVIARFAETDANVEFLISQDSATGRYIIQTGFTTCNFGSNNTPPASFDLGDSTSNVQTFEDTGANQQFILTPITTLPFSGNGVGVNTSTPEGVLDVSSTNSGVILPRVADVFAVNGAVNGMLVYDTSLHCVRAFANGHWSSCMN